jgi:MIP family channel proteins
VRKLGEQCAAEFLGVFVFVFVGAGAAILSTASGAGMLGVALATGLTMGVAISALGHISGGHFNPAVTVGAWVTGKVESPRAGLYILVQLLASAAAATLLRITLPKRIWEPTSLGATLLNPAAKSVGFTAPKGLLLEAAMTFFLVLVVFGTAIDDRGAFKAIAGLGIGLAITADILIGGILTGASMNPARSFGPALLSWNWSNFWIYILGPLAGAVIAAEVYWFFFLRSREEEGRESEGFAAEDDDEEPDGAGEAEDQASWLDAPHDEA